MKGFVKAGRVAKLFGVTLKTIHNWEAKEGFPVAVETPGGHRVFRSADVVAVLKRYGMAVPEDLEGAGDVAVDDGATETKIVDIARDSFVVSWKTEDLRGHEEAAVLLDTINSDDRVFVLDLPGIAALRRALDRAEAAYRARVK